MESSGRGLGGFFGGGGKEDTKLIAKPVVKKAPVKPVVKKAPAKPVKKAAEPRIGGGLFSGAFANVDINDKPTSKKATAPKPVSKPAKNGAPAGVPRLVNWRISRDGGIDGQIVGSPNFDDGEGISTSPIVKGRLDSGNVVTTGSGSKYYLD